MDDRSTPDTVALLRATLEATHDGIIVVDMQRRVLLWNDRLLRMLGITADIAAAGVDAIDAALIPQIENADELRETSRQITAHPGRAIQDVVRFRDGRVYERYIAPHHAGGGVAYLVATVHDMTAAATLRRELEQQRAILEQAQEVAHIGSWVAELDESEHTSWSSETYRIFGVEPSSFGGTRTAFFSLVHPDDREAVAAASRDALAHKDRYEMDHRIVRRDRRVRWVREEADIVRDASGTPRRMIGTVQDITDRRQLEDQLRQAQKMEAIGRLAGGIAHDINNALTAIAGYTELALAEVAPDHPARADVEEIRRAAERAASVTRQLLAFSRKQMIEPRLFNVNDTVTALARLLSRLVGPDVTVRTQLSEGLRPIVGDPGQIEQAIVNLAVNARDAMPNGGAITLETSHAVVTEQLARTHAPMPAGEYVRLAVSDSGLGMSAETQARIFEPFFTTKEAGKGTGLGLSMVYGTLKQIGGFIFVNSELGRGTTFTLYFPPAPASMTAAALAPVGTTARRRTILVAEHEDAVRNLVASALGADYEILLARTADEALRMADVRTEPVDLLLTDAVMPGQSGVELAAALRHRWPSLRVVFLSESTHDGLSIGDGAPPAAVVQKPLTPSDLRRRIRDLFAAS